MLQIRKAVRSKAKLRLGISAPSGAGKTYSSLLVASGIGGKIGLIDTENGSGDLYADLLPDGYDVITLTAPFEPRRYIEAVKAFEQAGYGVIIVDSLSHAWNGVGGLLDKQGKLADKSGNSWSAWRTVTPEHNALVDALLQSPCHIIATMRSKSEYVQERDEKTGKQVVRKIGMAPIMRDGIEYEFTVFLDLDHQHFASSSKDRTGMFDGQYFVPGADTGKKLLDWLEAGVEPPAPQPQGMNESAEADHRSAIEAAADTDALKVAWDAAKAAAQASNDEEAYKRLKTAMLARYEVVKPKPGQQHSESPAEAGQA